MWPLQLVKEELILEDEETSPWELRIDSVQGSYEQHQDDEGQDDDVTLLDEWRDELLEGPLVKTEPDDVNSTTLVEVATVKVEAPSQAEIDYSRVRIKKEPTRDPPSAPRRVVTSEPVSNRRIDFSSVRVKTEPAEPPVILTEEISHLPFFKVKTEPTCHRVIDTLPPFKVKTEPTSHRGIDTLPPFKVKTEPSSHRGIDTLPPFKVKTEPSSHRGIDTLPPFKVKTEPFSHRGIDTLPPFKVKTEPTSHRGIDTLPPFKVKTDPSSHRGIDHVRVKSEQLPPLVSPPEEEAHRVELFAETLSSDDEAYSPTDDYGEEAYIPDDDYGPAPSSRSTALCPMPHQQARQPVVVLSRLSPQDLKASRPVLTEAPPKQRRHQSAERSSRTPEAPSTPKRRSTHSSPSPVKSKRPKPSSPEAPKQHVADSPKKKRIAHVPPPEFIEPRSVTPPPQQPKQVDARRKSGYESSPPRKDSRRRGKSDVEHAEKIRKLDTTKKELEAASKPTRRELPVLPPAKHYVSPKFDMRSPLEMAYDEPRKSYSSSHVAGAGESGETKFAQPVYPSWLDDVLSQVCQWKPEWLQECRRMDPNKIPEILRDGRAQNYKKPVQIYEFESPDQYEKHFRDALLFDLWCTVTRDGMCDISKAGIIVATDSPSPTNVKPLRGNMKRKTYVCHYGTTSNKLETFKQGDLVVLKNNSDDTQKSKMLFGYIVKVGSSNFLSNSIKLSEEIVHHHKNAVFRSSFTVTLYAADFPQDDPKTLEVLKIKTIYEEIELFKFLRDFQHSNLASLVFQPVYSLKQPPSFCLKTAFDIKADKKPAILYLMQDILHYEAPSISVVEGGPGTGKTHLLTALAQELVEQKSKKARDCRIIIASKSNNQVNSIVKKLLKRKRLPDNNERNRDPNSFKLVRLGGCNQIPQSDNLVRNVSLRKLAERHQREQKAQPSEEKRRLLQKQIKIDEQRLAKFKKREMMGPNGLSSDCARRKIALLLLNEQTKNEKLNSKEPSTDAERVILEGADILVTTLACSFNRLQIQYALNASSRKRKHNVLMVDDASEVTEPSIIKLIVLFGITDVVLFGDFKQHDPFVPSKWARNAGLAVPLMERYKLALQQAGIEGKASIQPQTAGMLPIHRLTKQYRMQEEIASSFNKHLYNSEMVLCKHDYNHPFRPHVWLNCTYFEKDCTIAVNQEAELVSKLGSAILENNEFWRDRVKVVCFSKKISRALSSSENMKDICLNPDHLASVECDILILSWGPFMDYRTCRTKKLIVALSRACKSLFICGNFSNIRDTEFPRQMMSLLKDAKYNNYLEDITDSEISSDDLLLRIKCNTV